jgi:hypothetical protein
MKKLIIIVSPLYVRNYIETDAFKNIKDKDTFFVCSDNLSDRDKKSIMKYGNFSGEFGTTDRRSAFFIFISTLLMYANRNKNKGFYFYFRKGFAAIYFPSLRLKGKVREWTSNKIIQKIIITVLEFLRPIKNPLRSLQCLLFILVDFFGLSNLIVNLYKKILPINKDLESIIKQTRPDLVLIPNGGLNVLVADVINLSLKKYSYKTMLLIDNWDNISGKSRFVFDPDFLCVWGEQSKGFASKFHDFDESKVFLAGTPRFDVYYENKFSENFLKGINFPYILFAGCWAHFDEISALETLNGLVEKYNNLLPSNCKILYRPHPWSANYDKLDFLRSKNLKNIEIDPQMSHNSRPDNWLRRTDFQPKLDYYPMIIGNSEFIICPLSSMVIEGSIMSKKVLAIAYDDDKHILNPSVLYENSDYFDKFHNMTNISLLRNQEGLDAAFHEMIISDMPVDPEALSYYIVDDKKLYPERIQEICSRLTLV